MTQPQYIDAFDFMKMLKSNNLIIVSASEFEANNQILRKKLMKRKAISCSEIVKAGFFPIKSSKTVLDWCQNGKIKPTEFYQEETGKNRIMILTQAIKRLGYDE